MLLWILDRLSDEQLAWLDKTTPRAALAAVLSFVLAVLLGPRLISWLRDRFREPIKTHSPRLNELHQDKQATPTMGGLFLVAGLAAGVLLLGDLSNRFVQVALVTTLGMAALGAIDDLAKLRQNRHGISARSKLLGQSVVALLAAVLLHDHLLTVPGGLELTLPLTSYTFQLGWLYVPLAVLVIVGSSNAVNLTDGLDGLAGGCLLFAAGAMGAVAYACGHVELAEYLHLPQLAGANELLVLAAAMIGGLLGFLWFNCHPAQVFMGDTGSLPLGALLGVLAVATRQELLLVLIGGVFVAEAGSVILQVAWFRSTGRRVFLCAPLHHHFQFRGWAENTIVVRFWIAAALCAVLGLGSLKLSTETSHTTVEQSKLQHTTVAR